MPELTKIDITLRISSIKTLKFFVNNTSDAVKHNREAFLFNISVASDLNPAAKIIGFNVIQDVFLDKEMKNKVCELITRIEYNIINFDDIVVKKEKQILMPDSLSTMLLSISLSTARGVLASKLEGSALEGVNMPIVNPSNFKPVDKVLVNTDQSTLH